jgi:AraC-like DNA-binding protein
LVEPTAWVGCLSNDLFLQWSGHTTLWHRQPGICETVHVLPPSTRLVIELFESSPSVLFCVKGADGRYLVVNDMFVRRMRRRQAGDLIGRTVDDFFPPDLAVAYRAEDRALLQSGMTRKNQLEVITDDEGRREWFLTTRVLHREAGFNDVIVAVSTNTELGSSADDLGAGLRAATDLAAQPGRRGLRVTDLADAARLSTDQLERAMRRVLGVSPKQHLMAIRLERAASLLVTTNESLSDVAVACDYYDQSQFTTYFKEAYGVTPRQFRMTSAPAQTSDEAMDSTGSIDTVDKVDQVNPMESQQSWTKSWTNGTSLTGVPT